LVPSEGSANYSNPYRSYRFSGSCSQSLEKIAAGKYHRPFVAINLEGQRKEFEVGGTIENPPISDVKAWMDAVA